MVSENMAEECYFHPRDLFKGFKTLPSSTLKLEAVGASPAIDP